MALQSLQSLHYSNSAANAISTHLRNNHFSETPNGICSVHNSPDVHAPLNLTSTNKMFGFSVQFGNGNIYASKIPNLKIGMGGAHIMQRQPGLHSTHTLCKFHSDNGKKSKTLHVRVNELGAVHSISSTQKGDILENSSCSSFTVMLSPCPGIDSDISGINFAQYKVVHLDVNSSITLTNVQAANTKFICSSTSTGTINIYGGDFSGATFDIGATAPMRAAIKMNIYNSNFSNATIAGVAASGDSPDPALVSVDISGGNFTGAIFKGIFGPVSFVNGNFSYMDFSQMIMFWEDSELARTDGVPRIFKGNFSHANFNGIQNAGGEIVARATNFIAADLTGANMCASSCAPDPPTSIALLKYASITWRNTTCPDGTNSDNDGQTCINNL